MKHWSGRNSYLEANVHVINIVDHHKISKNVESIDKQRLWPSEEFLLGFEIILNLPRGR